ncbi:hypothetical protein [Stieleria marina]|uniref:hypothetical protein n=1 Tax=Stieleria marina TaxID=1930275 RepID=UPI003AF3CEFB
MTYSVPTKVPEQLLPGKDRMLAAMVPKDDQVWFFKVTGPEESIATIDKAFETFVKSIEFSAGKPDLAELPDGWRRGGEKPFRYASIDVMVPGKQLDISISKLSKQDDWDKYVAMNVNRWRGQLGLESSEDKWAGGDSIDVASADGQSVWVDMLGDPSKASNSMAPPFARGPMSGSMAGGPMSGGPPSTSPAKETAAPKADSRLKFDTPEGWRDGKKSMMRLAAFNVGPEDTEAVITVMQAGGDLRANVARWIGQIRQGQVPDDVVDQAMADAQEVKVAGRDAKRYVLTGEKADEGDAIDATIVPLEGGFSMFVKMTGPAATVSDQNDAMVEFLESLKF